MPDFPLSITPVTGTYSKANDLLEQNVFQITAAKVTKFTMGFLDLVNLTQTTTIRVYVSIDAVNNRIIDQISWTVAHQDGLPVTELTVQANQVITVSVQSAVLEGNTRDIPYSYTLKEE